MATSTALAAEPELRQLTTTVAWLYHGRHLRQGEIADRMGISQSRVSRLLDQATSMGIVQAIVVLPHGAGSALESELERAYGLREAHVYDLGRETPERDLVAELGQLLALHLQSAPLDEQVIGFTSWSRTLAETVRQLRPLRQAKTKYVVETLGDLGPPVFQHQTSQNTQRLADLTGATPVFLRTPGVLADPDPDLGRIMLDHDRHAQAALRMHEKIELALIGIGSGHVVEPLKSGDNFFTAKQFAHARSCGAVGEVNLRFIDAAGDPVHTELDELVVGATLKQLCKAPRRIAVAGGPAKYKAVRAALRGGWINTLVTDAPTARYLLDNR